MAPQYSIGDVVTYHAHGTDPTATTGEILSLSTRAKTSASTLAGRSTRVTTEVAEVTTYEIEDLESGERSTVGEVSILGRC